MLGHLISLNFSTKIKPAPIGFWDSVGLSGWLTTLSFVMLSLVSANTVATELYLQAVTYTSVMIAKIPAGAAGGGLFKFIVEWSPTIMLICAPGFELAIANFGFTEARREKKMDYTRNELAAPMAVLLLSGLSRALVLTPEKSWFYPFVSFLRYCMEIATVVGAPLTAFTASRIFATLFNQWEAGNKELLDNWKAEIDRLTAEWKEAKNVHKLGLAMNVLIVGFRRRPRRKKKKPPPSARPSMTTSQKNNLSESQIELDRNQLIIIRRKTK